MRKGYKIGGRSCGFLSPTGSRIIGVLIDQSDLGMSSSEVDAYLIALAADKTCYNCVINLLGNSSNTYASAEAIEILTSSPYYNIIETTNDPYGDEIITNQADREFSSDTGWWLKSFFKIEGGHAVPTYTGSGVSIRRSDVLEIGSTYLVSFQMSNYDSSGLRITDGSNTPHAIVGGDQPTGSNYTYNEDGTYSVEITALSTTLALELTGFGNVPPFYIDNVSLKKVL